VINVNLTIAPKHGVKQQLESWVVPPLWEERNQERGGEREEERAGGIRETNGVKKSNCR